MESEKVVVDELPLAIVRRVVKEKLTECSPDYDVSIHKEALLAFSESARIFIHYLSATANDFCKDARRQTMKADDVLKALDEMDFSEFLEPLKASLEDFKKKNAGKKAGGGAALKPAGGAATKPTETRKRKQEGPSTQKNARKIKRDDGGNKNDEENENDNTEEENGNDEENENDDENTEENGNDEESEKEDEESEKEDEENEKEDEGNSMEDNGIENDESGNEDNSVEEIGSENDEDNDNNNSSNSSGEEEEGDEEDD